jgi:hypothetical protein
VSSESPGGEGLVGVENHAAEPRAEDGAERSEEETHTGLEDGTCWRAHAVADVWHIVIWRVDDANGTVSLEPKPVGERWGHSATTARLSR